MLPKAKRMKGEEITLLFSRAKTLKNPLFLMKYMKKEEMAAEKAANSAGFAKIAVAAAKKVFPTAVLRNKARRRIYNAVKAAGVDTFPYFIVFMPNREAIETPYKNLVAAIESSCKELKKSQSRSL